MSRLTIALVVLAALLTTAASADREQARALLAQARPLIDQARYDEARPLLNEALLADPRYPDTWVNLGYFEERQSHIETALAAYGRALTLFPAQPYAQERFRALFFAGRFPRRLPVDQLSLAPVPLTADLARATNSFPLAAVRREQRLAYTTGLLYPDAMRAAGAPPTVTLPATGEVAGQKLTVNRVCYGYTGPIDSPSLTMRVAVYYPSPLLSAAGADYSALAVRLTHWLTRLFAYYELHLGIALPTEPTSVYLCETGPAGAETFGDALFFYDVAKERPALEWMREAAHETGHLLLPRMGRFIAPETWASGHAGERLAFQWLAQESGLVTDAPWPSSAAQDHLPALWDDSPLPLARYRAERCRPLLDTWAQAGPDAPQLTNDSEPGLSYLCGFLLWVQAAHDDPLLAATLTRAGGTNATDFLKSYQDAVEARLQAAPGAYLPLWAGALNLPASRLTTKPLEGALRRENLSLGPGDRAAYRLYLPAGVWRVTIVGSPGAALTVRLDDDPTPLPAGADKHTQVALTIAQPGWHTLSVEATGQDPVVLDYLRLEAARET